MKNVSDEMLRQIGNNREWTKRYGVVSEPGARTRARRSAISLGLVVAAQPARHQGAVHRPQRARGDPQAGAEVPRRTGQRQQESVDAWPTTTRSSGVARNATAADIRKAYVRLARERHPDRFTDPAEKKQAEEAFTELTAAFNALSNERSRREYDAAPGRARSWRRRRRSRRTPTSAA